ncbi:MAG: chromate transporter, partial [Candidatus Methylomirabilales bacterium]
YMPVYLIVINPSPWYKRHGANPQVKAFVDGETAAAPGAIAGACVVLGRRAIFDIPTLLIALITVAVVWRFKIPEPVLIAIAGITGLLLSRG